MGNPFIFAVRFLKEVNVEMKKVKWPSRNELIEYTVVVLVISAVVGIYLGALDFAFQEGFGWVLEQFNGGETGGEVPVEESSGEGSASDPGIQEDPNATAGGEGEGSENEPEGDATGEESTNAESTNNN